MTSIKQTSIKQKSTYSSIQEGRQIDFEYYPSIQLSAFDKICCTSNTNDFVCPSLSSPESCYRLNSRCLHLELAIGVTRFYNLHVYLKGFFFVLRKNKPFRNFWGRRQCPPVTPHITTKNLASANSTPPAPERSRLQSVAAGARDRGLRAPMVRQRVGPGTALRAAGGAGMRRRARFVGGDR